MGQREERIAKNETLFREVNERIEEISNQPEAEFLCECGDAGCTSPVLLTLVEYERVRTDATCFAVLPGHEIPEIEIVVDRGDRFYVVRKNEPTAAVIATEHDPRS